MGSQTGAELLVKCLEAQGVKVIFGIPGAKIDAVFNALVDSSIKLIVCRHEQNAAFMAAAYGRVTGHPGVVLVTSGPGVANLATGLLTATTEGDPVIAIGANVPCAMLQKASHQSANNVVLHKANAKLSVEIYDVSNVPEIMDNAFRQACAPRRGACFISIPQDVLTTKTKLQAQTALPRVCASIAADHSIASAVSLIQQARFPVLLLGEEASRIENTKAIRVLLETTKLPTVSTYQAAGVVSRALLPCFVGRVGLFKNQPGDKLLEAADLVITIGYNPVEYDPETWHAKNDKTIVHVDYKLADIHNTYRPQCEVTGDIASNVLQLSQQLTLASNPKNSAFTKKLQTQYQATIESGADKASLPIHPLRFIYELRNAIHDQTRVVCDVGSVYMWMARYFLCYEPHHLLFSNGQQTLGVALPWAIGLHYASPQSQVVSISGDGGFLFSAMELETAVREQCHFVHFIWRDQRYNMVYEQELMKYHRGSGVDLGKLDVPAFAKGFGATGFVLEKAEDFAALFKQAQQTSGPVLIDVPIDYSDNPQLFKDAHSEVGN